MGWAQKFLCLGFVLLRCLAGEANTAKQERQ